MCLPAELHQQLPGSACHCVEIPLGLLLERHVQGSFSGSKAIAGNMATFGSSQLPKYWSHLLGLCWELADRYWDASFHRNPRTLHYKAHISFLVYPGKMHTTEMKVTGQDCSWGGAGGGRGSKALLQVLTARQGPYLRCSLHPCWVLLKYRMEKWLWKTL